MDLSIDTSEFKRVEEDFAGVEVDLESAPNLGLGTGYM